MGSWCLKLYGEWAVKKFDRYVDEVESGIAFVTFLNPQLKCDIITNFYWNMKKFLKIFMFLAKWK